MPSSSANRRRVFPLKSFSLAAVSALAATLAASMPASAQTIFFGWGPSPEYGLRPPAPIYRPVAPRYVPAPAFPDDDLEGPQARRLSGAEVSRILRARGMRVSGMPIRNGGVYVADVYDRAGNPRRLIVDGYYGRVIQTFPGAAIGAEPRIPGPRLAGRPPAPDIDADMPSPTVIPGVGPGSAEPRTQKPKARQSGPNKPAKTAAKPALAAPPPVTPPKAVAPAAVLPAAPEPALPAPAPEQPAAAPVAPPAPATAAAPPVEPVIIPAPDAAAPAPADKEAATPPPDTSGDRPRRRVRFIKPDSPTVADPNVPGGQLVPIPEPPAIDLTPRSAEAPATGATGTTSR